MLIRLAAALCLVMALHALGNNRAEAQSQDHCANGHLYFFGDPQLPGSYGCDGYPGALQYVCLNKTDQCSPPPETRSWCPAGGKPICLSSGNTFIDELDVSVPGLGGGLTLRRTWNSTWPIREVRLQFSGMFGPNWRSTYEETVFVGEDHYIKYGRGDGDFWSFGESGNGSWGAASPGNIAANLQNGLTYWTLTFQNGEKRHFDNVTGSLIAIIDRNGNTTQLNYDSFHRLTTVTDPASRHLTFTYGVPGNPILVSNVSSDVGLSLNYAYDSQGRLSTVTKPDLTTISFVYNDQSLITSVIDANGKILESHTYDSLFRGLTSSQANGVNAMAVTYPIN